MKQNHIYQSLVAVSEIMCSDEDQPVVQELFTGYDAQGNLIVTAEYFDYENELYDNCTYIKLPHAEARRLARKLQVPYIKLPEEIAECMWEWREIINPTPAHVEGCFNDIYERLLDEGCHVSHRKSFFDIADKVTIFAL